MMPAKIPVVVAGAAGRMGRRLVAAVAQDPELLLAGAFEVKGHPDAGKDAGVLAGVGPLEIPVAEEPEPLLEKAKVLIDFTTADATIHHLELCAARGVAMVAGTTGLSPKQKDRVAELSRAVPCVMAPNMSQGVNLLFRLVELAVSILGPEFDIEIVEAHHRLKKDAPSGTALRLFEIAAAARGLDSGRAGRFSRQGITGERPPDEIGVFAVRAGDIVGEHTVLLAGPGERIELTHRAHSRDTFAKGAVRAAKWIVNQGPGLYDMQDVLGLRKS